MHTEMDSKRCFLEYWLLSCNLTGSFFHSSLLTNYFWKSFKNYLAECKKSVKDHISKNTKKSVKVEYKIPTELAYDGSVRTGSMGSQESNKFR